MGCTISSSSALSGCLCRATLFEMPSPIDLISIPARSLRGLPVGLIDADRLRHEPVGSRNQLTLATRAVQVPSLKAEGLVRSMLCATLCAVVVQASMNLAMNLQLGGTCIESTYVRELSFSEGGTKESTKDRASPRCYTS